MGVAGGWASLDLDVTSIHTDCPSFELKKSGDWSGPALLQRNWLVTRQRARCLGLYQQTMWYWQSRCKHSFSCFHSTYRLRLQSDRLRLSCDQQYLSTLLLPLFCRFAVCFFCCSPFPLCTSRACTSHLQLTVISTFMCSSSTQRTGSLEVVMTDERTVPERGKLFHRQDCGVNSGDTFLHNFQSLMSQQNATGLIIRQYAGQWGTALNGNSALRTHIARATSIELTHYKERHVVHYLRDVRKFYGSTKGVHFDPAVGCTRLPSSDTGAWDAHKQITTLLKIKSAFSNIISGCTFSILAGC